jgi:hypothetical protein
MLSPLVEHSHDVPPGAIVRGTWGTRWAKDQKLKNIHGAGCPVAVCIKKFTSLLSASRYEGKVSPRIECSHLRHGEPLGFVKDDHIFAESVAVDNEVKLLFRFLDSHIVS